MTTDGSDSSQLALPVEPLSVQPSPSVLSCDAVPDAQPFANNEWNEYLAHELGLETPVSPAMAPAMDPGMTPRCGSPIASPVANPAGSPIASDTASSKHLAPATQPAPTFSSNASTGQTQLDSAELDQLRQNQPIKQSEQLGLLPPAAVSSRPSPSPSPSPTASNRSRSNSIPSDDLIAMFEAEMPDQIVSSGNFSTQKPADEKPPSSEEQSALMENINFIKAAIANGVKATITLLFIVAGGGGRAPPLNKEFGRFPIIKRKHVEC